MSLYSIFVHIHSGFRWIVLAGLLTAIINSVIKLAYKRNSNKVDSSFNRLSMVATHVQVLIGLVLYFISPKVIFSASAISDSFQMFFLVEHVSLMIIAIILITKGYIQSDRTDDEINKQINIVVYYSIALLLILISIPWPFRGLGGAWY